RLRLPDQRWLVAGSRLAVGLQPHRGGWCRRKLRLLLVGQLPLLVTFLLLRSRFGLGLLVGFFLGLTLSFGLSVCLSLRLGISFSLGLIGIRLHRPHLEAKLLEVRLMASSQGLVCGR